MSSGLNYFGAMVGLNRCLLNLARFGKKRSPPMTFHNRPAGAGVGLNSEPPDRGPIPEAIFSAIGAAAEGDESRPRSQAEIDASWDRAFRAATEGNRPHAVNALDASWDDALKGAGS